MAQKTISPGTEKLTPRISEYRKNISPWEDVPALEFVLQGSFKECLNLRFLKDKDALRMHGSSLINNIVHLLPKDVFSFCNCFSLKQGKLTQLCSVSCNLDNKLYRLWEVRGTGQTPTKSVNNLQINIAKDLFITKEFIKEKAFASCCKSVCLSQTYYLQKYLLQLSCGVYPVLNVFSLVNGNCTFSIDRYTAASTLRYTCGP